MCILVNTPLNPLFSRYFTIIKGHVPLDSTHSFMTNLNNQEIQKRHLSNGMHPHDPLITHFRIDQEHLKALGRLRIKTVEDLLYNKNTP